MIGCVGQGWLEFTLYESKKDMDAHCLSINLAKKSLRWDIDPSRSSFEKHQAVWNGRCLGELYALGLTEKDRTQYKAPYYRYDEKEGIKIKVKEGMTMEYKLNEKGSEKMKNLIVKNRIHKKDILSYYKELNNPVFLNKHKDANKVDEYIDVKILIQASQTSMELCNKFKNKIENTVLAQYVKQEVRDNFTTIIRTKFHQFQQARNLSTNTIVPTTVWFGCKTVADMEALIDNVRYLLETKRFETHFGSTGRLEAHPLTYMDKTIRKFLLQGNYDFDLEMCNAILIAKKVGANEFLANYNALNGDSVWDELGIKGQLKKEFKTAFYTRFFKSYFIGEQRKNFNKMIEPYLYFFADLFTCLDKYYKKLPKKQGLVKEGYAGERKNCLGIDFLPSKQEYRYTYKGLTSTNLIFSNLKGKYLAHLIQGEEQFIIQNLMLNIDFSFGYNYDGFSFAPESPEDLMLVEQTAREFLDNNGYPEMNFVIKEI